MSPPSHNLVLTTNEGVLMRIKILRQLLGLDPIRQNRVTKQTVNSPMDQGDYHSGPEGYSPNTAYPETQYGSRFDEEADWADGEH